MRVVVAAGVGALALTMPLTIAIVVVLGNRRDELPADDSRLPQWGWLIHRCE